MITNQPSIIEAWVDGRCFGSGAGIGVRLRYQNRHDWVRTMLCGSLTTNQAELRAVEYVLCSINEAFYDDPVLIITSNRYAEMMLQRAGDGWAKTASSNHELVQNTRDLFLRFGTASIKVAAPDDETMLALKQINEVAFKKGREVFDKEAR